MEIAKWINSNYEKAQYERWAAENLRVALEAEEKVAVAEEEDFLHRIEGMVFMWLLIVTVFTLPIALYTWLKLH